MTSFKLGRLGSQLKKNWFLSLSLAWLSSSLQSDGYLHSELMEEYLNGGVVNDKDLPPIIYSPLSHSSFDQGLCHSSLLLSFIPAFFLAFILYSCITYTLDHKAKHPTLPHLLRKI